MPIADLCKKGHSQEGLASRVSHSPVQLGKQMPSATEFLDLARTTRELAKRARRLSDEHALDGDATGLARHAQELDDQATSFEKLAAEVGAV